MSAVDNFDLPLMAFGGKLGRLHDLGSNPVAEFIDPWLGNKVNSGIGCCTGTPGYTAGGPVHVQQPYAGVDFIPQSGIYEFGYRFGGIFLLARFWRMTTYTSTVSQKISPKKLAFCVCWISALFWYTLILFYGDKKIIYYCLMTIHPRAVKLELKNCTNFQSGTALNIRKYCTNLQSLILGMHYAFHLLQNFKLGYKDFRNCGCLRPLTGAKFSSTVAKIYIYIK